MTDSRLLFTVRLTDPRYHGSPEWPPSPFRLYQALMAGALTGQPSDRGGELEAAFAWLESQPAPTVAVPPTRRGGATTLWVPNNDIDTVRGDPGRVAGLRTPKRVEPLLCTADSALLYAWPIVGDDHSYAETFRRLAERLYQLGRGVDMAFATAEILSADEIESRFAAHPGPVHRPTPQGQDGHKLRCPTRGSYASLIARHRAQGRRMHGGHLTQPPPPRFRLFSYDAQPALLLFDLMSGATATGHAPMPPTKAAWLVEQVRDRVASLLCRSFDAALVDRVVIGRKTTDADKPARVRIVSLPSIGFRYADRAIRRVLIVVPPDCPIPAREIEWAAGSVHLGATEDGEIVDETKPQLVRAADQKMLRHYGIGPGAAKARVWRTVTPAVLPTPPTKGRASGSARARREAEAARAVRRALRHAGYDPRGTAVRVQREPFEPKGTGASSFEVLARFDTRSRMHVEVIFPDPMPGPRVIGDGRYVGLGLMAPRYDQWRSVGIFNVPDAVRVRTSETGKLLSSVRRALLTLAESADGQRLAQVFAESPQAQPAGDAQDRASVIAADLDGDGLIDQLLVAAPWAIQGRSQRRDAAGFDRVISELPSVPLASLGHAPLTAAQTTQAADSLLAGSFVWESLTPYCAIRTLQNRGDQESIVAELRDQCVHRGLPRPDVEVSNVEDRTAGVVARVRLTFSVVVHGPIVLGRETHVGSGVFRHGELR